MGVEGLPGDAGELGGEERPVLRSLSLPASLAECRRRTPGARATHAPAQSNVSWRVIGAEVLAAE